MFTLNQQQAHTISKHPPDVAPGAVSGLAHHFRCHPVRRAAHGLEQTILAVDRRLGADVETQSLGAAEVDEFNLTVLHHHDVAALDVPAVTHTCMTPCRCTLLKSAGI